MKRDLVSFALWSGDQINDLLSLSLRLKTGGIPDDLVLEGKTVALVFERESLRTRVSFEVGIVQLGGHPVFLQQETIGMATRESVHDIAQVLSQYVCCIVARTIHHQTCLQLAESASVPVINALTDLVHPCQILADALTLKELGKFGETTRIVYLGVGNNITNSWLELAERIPLTLTIACPPGFEPHPQMLQQAKQAGVSSIRILEDPVEAARDADVVYTDVWSSAKPEFRAHHGMALAPFQVNRKLLAVARPDCLVMHRLPANRGEEITSDVLDGKHSVVLKQALNRVHVQKAVLTRLLRPAD